MNKPKNKTTQTKDKNYYKLIQFGVACVVILFVLVNKFKTTHSELITQNRDTSEITDSTTYRNLAWADYSRTVYNLDYTIKTTQLSVSTNDKNAIRIPTSAWATNTTYWAAVYQQLLINDKDFIISIADSLSNIRKERNLNTAQFANVIMTFVQDIEYSFVFKDRECHKKPNTPCVEGQNFGILTPTEFLYSLNGDCDTRAVLLMGVYKHLGYDPAIAISEAYRHAMLLLNLPSAGSYLNRFGKKYYFWETTAKNWKLGNMPPATNNLKHWKIVL